YEQAAAESTRNGAALAKWWEQGEEWRGRRCLAYEGSDSIIKPQFVIEKLWEVTGGKAIVTSDVGQHQMWAAQYYKLDEPRRWLNPGGVGTMGVGLPYAMGGQMATPEAEIACITGEGPIPMHLQPLSACQQDPLAPCVLCLNSRYLG